MAKKKVVPELPDNREGIEANIKKVVHHDFNPPATEDEVGALVEEFTPTAPQHIVDKTYSYMVADAKGVLRRHSFKESQATEDDIMHFVRTLGEVYDKAPYLAKVNFMFHAFPVFRHFMREHEPEILAAIMHEPEANPN